MITSFWFSTDLFSYWLFFECQYSLSYLSESEKAVGISFHYMQWLNLYLSEHADGFNYFVPRVSPLIEGDGGPTLFRSIFSNFLSALGRVFEIFRPL